MTLNDIENFIKRNHSEKGLQYFLNRWGVTVNVYSSTKVDGVDDDPYYSVYGEFSGEEEDSYTTTTVLLTGDEFSSIGEMSTGTFTGGYLFSNTGVVQTGDRVDVVREDSLKRSYKVIKEDSIGLTVSVLQRFIISSMDI